MGGYTTRTRMHTRACHTSHGRTGPIRQNCCALGSTSSQSPLHVVPPKAVDARSAVHRLTKMIVLLHPRKADDSFMLLA